MSVFKNGCLYIKIALFAVHSYQFFDEDINFELIY